ncbi:signal peptidase complex subunit SPC3 KNAG_0E03060 [Huiozyma naganishii CBS 8797]|uniref:Signal peptidase subunit 3 n=1 Tax=Huiozyma naganishii (strain ATCC MYA-139 / BCRC 22969 / CBS 8797 / KCTC 17520 / NBRC 10181 / NCYC 3082 / Yp74L-3) TaxID=1071383 RepID=J7R6T8_HUIN7|nr:hypothetical protein KNAG_0E03060 [Kazachstania naganishii CBS 8797]CCK70565.1 hypothetical protein KNAG_0E03060 [Kazachstania naganishii CBS 8797]
MFSLSQRFQTVSNTAVTVGLFLAAFIIGTSWFQLVSNHAFDLSSSISNVTPKINVRTSRYYGSVNGKAKENAKVSFDLEADLTKLFNWNTKQVFTYLTAEYENVKHTRQNEVTFWDKIITSKDDAVLNLTDAQSKYHVWDVQEKLTGKDLKLKLHWNIQPWVGPLVYGETDGTFTLSIPEREKTEKKAKESESAESSSPN